VKLTKPEPGQPILVELRGKLLEIRYSLGTLKDLARDHKISVLKGDAFLKLIEDPEKFTTVLHAGLAEIQPEVTREWVEKNIDASMFAILLPYLGYAMSGRWSAKAANIDDGDDAEISPLVRPAAAEEAPPTGSPSGALVAMISDSPTRNSGG